MNKVAPKELGIPEEIPLSKRKDWRIGMVGFGGIAVSHINAYRRAGFDVIAIADISEERRKLAEEKFGIKKIYKNYPDLIADSDVEIIDLLTHPVLRYEVVKKAAEAGKHIIMEKPFALTVKECEKMIEVAKRNKIKLAVHQNYRWMRMNYLAKHIIDKGLIGEPFFASIEIFGSQDVHLVNMPFYSKRKDFITLQWNNHLSDLLRYWTGRNAKKVFARTGRMKNQNFTGDNMINVIADFGSHVTGHILHSELCRTKTGMVQCRVDGNKGSIVFDFHNEMRIYSLSAGKEERELDVSGCGYVDSFAGSMGNFLLAIEDNKEPMVSGKQNLVTIRTILSEYKSSQRGGSWINVRK